MNDLNRSKASNTKAQSFEFIDAALSNLGCSEECKMLMYKWIAAILHLGNIQFGEGDSGFCEITKSSMLHLNYAADLLKIDEKILNEALLLNQVGHTRDTYVFRKNILK